MKEQLHKLEKIEDIKRFITGGKSIFTLESERTGNWFTYRVKKAKKDDEKSPYFVSVLTGKNNDSAYSYMGTIFNNNGKLVFNLTKKSNMTKDAMSYKAFNFFFDLVQKNKLHKEINFYHKGKCARCGRTLTVPSSILNGFGPECNNLN